MAGMAVANFLVAVSFSSLSTYIDLNFEVACIHHNIMFTNILEVA